jgi:hypothetical protein
MKFIVPVVYTVSGHITIEAKDMQEALKKAAVLNDEGVASIDIQDCDVHSECILDEVSRFDESEPDTEKYREVADGLCNVCKVFEHDTCANNPNCSCCLDAMRENQ